MGETKCTFGVRMPIDISMLNEIIRREVKHFRIYKHYRPNFASTPVSAKPSSAHYQLKEETREEMEKVDDYFQHIAQTRVKGPKCKHTLAATENQIYGWYATPLVPMDRSDRRFYMPQRESRDTKIEVIIHMCNPKRKSSK